MDTVLQSLPNLHIRGQIRGDDTVDQFHHFITVYLLAFGGFLIGLKEFVGEPLDCWVNLSNWQHFQGHVNSYCWAHKLYKFPNASDYSQVPYPLQHGLSGPGDDVDVEGLGELNFYRWVTVIFFVQAFLFKLPSLIWSELNTYSGTKIVKLVSMVTDTTFDAPEKRDAVFSTMAEFIEAWLKINRKPFGFMKTETGHCARRILGYCMVCVGGNTGNYLSTMYLAIKLLFLLNVLVQFFILSDFLDFNYWTYGTDAIDTIQSDGFNARFPRVGLCHFQLQGEGHWIQCILSVNMLLEMIYLVLWAWLLFLLVITVYSLASWSLKILQTNLSVGFVTRYLIYFHPDGKLSKDETKSADKFVMHYLGNDGVFLLRILATNTNDVAMAELVRKVWRRYLDYGHDGGGVGGDGGGGGGGGGGDGGGDGGGGGGGGGLVQAKGGSEGMLGRIVGGGWGEVGTVLDIDKKRID